MLMPGAVSSTLIIETVAREVLAVVGQDIAGIDQVAVFIKINFAAIHSAKIHCTTIVQWILRNKH